jgi:hypothetical protein
VHAAATRTEPPFPPPIAAAPPSPSDQAPPHPLDHITYEFTPAHADPYPYARFAGHLPALRLPTPRPGGVLTRCTARQALVVWSVVDLWAFATALRVGPSPLAVLALAGTIATCWHLRTVSRRRIQVSKTTTALGPALADLAPLGAAASRRPSHQRDRARARQHTTFAPRQVRRRRLVVGTRRPSDWFPGRLSPGMLMAVGSVLTGAVVHAALSGAGSLH